MKYFVVHNPELIEEVLKDPQLSLKAKAMYCIMASFYYGWELTLTEIQSKCMDSKHVIEMALTELEIYGLIASAKGPL